MWSPTISSDELWHHGIKGMHWGDRRYQNPDGSLTPAGRARYGVQGSAFDKSTRKVKTTKYTGKKVKSSDEVKDERREKFKKAAIIGGAVVGTALVAYGGYKASQFIKYKGMANRKIAAEIIDKATRNANAMSIDNLGLFGEKGAKDQAKFDKYFKEFSTKYTKETKGQATKLAKQAVKDETKYAKDYVGYLKDKMDPYGEMFGPALKPKKSSTIRDLEKYSKKAAKNAGKKASNSVLKFGGESAAGDVNKTLNKTLSELSKIASSDKSEDEARKLAEELIKKNQRKL